MKEFVNKFYSDPYSSICFLHIREPKEIRKAKKEFGRNHIVKTLLIKNDNVGIIETNKSDASVLKFKYDITILNNGTEEELKQKAIDFFKDYNKGGFKPKY
jgi:hypothetical protein